MVCTDLKRQIEELRKENLDLKFEIDLTMKRVLLKTREIGSIEIILIKIRTRVCARPTLHSAPHQSQWKYFRYTYLRGGDL